MKPSNEESQERQHQRDDGDGPLVVDVHDRMGPRTAFPLEDQLYLIGLTIIRRAL